jgi:uncharacterized membrane protein HdeD (DUF308 family)
MVSVTTNTPNRVNTGWWVLSMGFIGIVAPVVLICANQIGGGPGFLWIILSVPAIALGASLIICE